MKKKALFSLHDTRSVIDFAKRLVDQDWEIVATKETQTILFQAGVPVTKIEDLLDFHNNFGFPPTLHPSMEYSLTTGGLPRIDLVYITPYPLSEGNDVGGRTLLSLAAKGKRIPVMSVDDMGKVVSELEHGELPKDLHENLIDKVHAELVRHNLNLLAESRKYNGKLFQFHSILMNGENPYQQAGLYFDDSNKFDPLVITKFGRRSGEQPCFTNLADLDNILQTMCLAAESFKLNNGKIPYICVASKHGNACGIAIDSDDPVKAINKALFTNPKSIWGGEVIVNFDVNEQVAEALYRNRDKKEQTGTPFWMLDVIAAPYFSPEAVRILGHGKKKEHRKLLENRALYNPELKKQGYVHRYVRGGVISQTPFSYMLDLNRAQLVGNPQTKNINNLNIALAVAFTSFHGGNEVAIAKDNCLLGCGGGPSTIEAAEIAIMRAKRSGIDLKGSVFAADAYFPFTDAPELLIDEGVTTGVVPYGGKCIDSVQQLFISKDVDVYYLPSDIRGFCRH